MCGTWEKFCIYYIPPGRRRRRRRRRRRKGKEEHSPFILIGQLQVRILDEIEFERHP
jgi:hypothetical protein